MTINLIKHSWDTYVSDVLEGTTEYKEIKKHRMTFIAGALQIWIIVRQILDEKDMSDAAKALLYSEISKELTGFVHEIAPEHCSDCPDRHSCTERPCN